MPDVLDGWSPGNPMRGVPEPDREKALQEAGSAAVRYIHWLEHELRSAREKLSKMESDEAWRRSGERQEWGV